MLPKIKPHKPLIYLDHAATTYLDSRVEQAMKPFFKNSFGNPSSLYSVGRQARNAVDHARKIISGILNCKSDEIAFTAGGTESVNLAIFGVVREFFANNRSKNTKPHIIISSIEHHAVLNSAEELVSEGAELTKIGVDEYGFVNIKELVASIKPNTVLVSVMYANNEIGTIEPIVEIGKELAKINNERIKNKLSKVLFHTDACQAAGVLDLNVQKLNVDLMSLNGSKIYGPKQSGLLFIKSGIKIKPLIFGGGQEKNLRSGTENVSGIVGLAEALKMAQAEKKKENGRLRNLRKYFYAQLKKQVPKIILNGPEFSDDNDSKPIRLPNNLNVSILDVEGEALLLYMDAYNVCFSTGSACTSASLDPSHVILAIGRPYEYAHGSMRFTLGKQTTKQQIDYVMKVLPGVVQELRRISPLSLNPKQQENVSVKKAFLGQNMKKFISKKSKLNV